MDDSLGSLRDGTASAWSGRTQTGREAPPRPGVLEYTVCWISALDVEYTAALQMRDEKFEFPVDIPGTDDTHYSFGRIGHRNVVFTPLDGAGTSPASAIVARMQSSFPAVRYALLVGIGGGAPTKSNDIRLGDVVVSEPNGQIGGVVQYDLGKALSTGEFKRVGSQNRPPLELLQILKEVRKDCGDPESADTMAQYVEQALAVLPGHQRPPTQDRLFRSDHKHMSGQTCDNCDIDSVVKRKPRISDRAFKIHYGTIASGNQVIKNAELRDQYANDPDLNVLCFEMEAGGLMNQISSLVIRGISDYCDSHKNDKWHGYAALTAAAFAKEVLKHLRPALLTRATTLTEELSKSCRSPYPRRNFSRYYSANV